MKEKLLRSVSYILVAALASVMTLVLADREVGLRPTKLEQLESLIQEKFIGEVAQDTLQDAAADAMVVATGDRWSYYIPASEYASYVETQKNAYVGIGVTIQLTEDESGFLIVDVAEGGPAQEAGLEVLDVLIAVEGESVAGMTTVQVRDRVKGKEGSFVSLTLLRAEEEYEVSVERRTVETPVATYAMLQDNVGLVTIANFDSRCARESIDAIEKLLEQGAEKLIFDVRYNPGGFASELVDLLDYLLPEGPLFRTVNYKGVENVDESDADFLDVPMAVLVNGDSYSAAEFFAVALKEYEAAVVVGEQTVGKGYFQTTYNLEDGSAVALSIGEYFTPKGKNLAGVGITPDVVVEVDEETAASIYYGTLSPEEDPQIQAAVEALK